MATYLITGANRGIGLEMTKQLLDLPASRVSKLFVLSRSGGEDLQALVGKHSDRAVHVHAAVDDTASVQKAADEVKAKLGGAGLDVLINNAGTTSYSPNGVASLDPEKFLEILNVNVVGVHRVTAAFLPLLEAGKEKKVMTISSSVGSIAWAERFGMNPAHAYKISKAGLNMLNAQYVLEHKEDGFIFLCISPGWLRTNLGGEYADLDVSVGVKETLRIISEATKAQNGKFVNIRVPGWEGPPQSYDGKEVPW